MSRTLLFLCRNTTVVARAPCWMSASGSRIARADRANASLSHFEVHTAGSRHPEINQRSTSHQPAINRRSRQRSDGSDDQMTARQASEFIQHPATRPSVACVLGLLNPESPRKQASRLSVQGLFLIPETARWCTAS